MKYDFDRVIERKGTNSSKWDQLEKLFGAPDVLPMWVADMDFEAPPEVVEALEKRANHGIFGYTVRPQSYYDAYMQWQKDRHGWKIEQEWICTCPGVVTAISMIIDVLTAPGDRIMVQVPVYHPFYDMIALNGREIVRNPLRLENGRYTMDFELIERQFAEDQVKALLLCNPHNPVGRVWTSEELTRLSELCIKYNIMVFSDEIHKDIVYKGHNHIPIASLSEISAQQTVTFTAPSKTFNIAGLQSSTLIIPNKEWRQKYIRKQKTLALDMENCFAAVAAECCYTSGGPWLDALLAYLEENRDTVLRFVEQELPEVTAFRSEGTYLVWMDCRNISPSGAELKKLMFREAGVAFSEGSGFGKEGEGFVRVNIGCPRPLLLEGLQRFADAVHRRRPQQ
ncbi:MalY/PatB family protein [Paenibacillus thalictri]|uniref:cysteine-S-conjugate beta-lyase n=1 Tax=Paenibacillus thalictri TaxID=2527873 RepID=A0A4Q9DI80_9BACL|nr:MalY/PatB family protein [Paenibacillus thalictri]TBL72934.1 pyridoxal phosphate-dependent aminotransferase [Paenibacillus thalictri]